MSSNTQHSTRPLRVAFTSSAPGWLDAHFGNCNHFSVYEVSEQGFKWLDTRTLTPDLKGEQRTIHAVRLLSDCQLMMTLSIGGPPAARLINTGIMPVKWRQKTPVETPLEQLSTRLADNPAPWLRKLITLQEQPSCLA